MIRKKSLNFFQEELQLEKTIDLYHNIRVVLIVLELLCERKFLEKLCSTSTCSSADLLQAEIEEIYFQNSKKRIF